MPKGKFPEKKRYEKRNKRENRPAFTLWIRT